MGRPRKYESNAERQRAYRRRKRVAKWGVTGSSSDWGKLGNVVKAAFQEHRRSHVYYHPVDDCPWCMGRSVTS